MQVLKDKSYRDYDKLSRYNNFPYYYNILDKKYIYGKTAWLDDETLYTLHKIEKNDTFDTLALYYYGNPTYYWIICSFNRITNPYEELKEGEYIKIPSISSIRFINIE